MENYARMKDIVDGIFCKHSAMSEKEIEQNLSVDMNRIRNILFLRKLMVSPKWKSFFDRLSTKIMSSLENYLFAVISACYIEHSVTVKNFDSFMNVCALVQSLSVEIFRKTKVNLFRLNPNIVMVFYEEYWKKYFKKKGFSSFKQYINEECRMWSWNYIILSHDSTDDPVFIDPKLEDHLAKEMKCLYHDSLKVLDNEPKTEAIWKSLAQRVISNLSVELPVFPNEPDLKARLEESKEKEIAKEKRKERVKSALTYRIYNPPSLETSISDSITNIVAKHVDFLEISLSGDILLITSVQLPALQNEPELDAIPETFQEKKIAKEEIKKRVEVALTYGTSIPALHRHLSSNSDSTTNNVAKQQEDSKNIEEIIQAVMRYNQSKGSVVEKADNQQYRNTEGILERFKNAMKSLTEFLDRFDTE